MLSNQKRKRVLFNDCSAAPTYVYDDELCIEEKKALWYQPEEIESFSSEVKRTVQELKQGSDKSLNEEERCLRGLEKYFSSNNKFVQRREVRRTFIKAMLEIQHERRKQIMNDPRGLQILASACSQNARKFARKLAAQDEAEAVQIYLSLQICVDTRWQFVEVAKSA